MWLLSPESNTKALVETPVEMSDKILAVLSGTPDVSFSELAYIVEKSVRTVERVVAKLVAEEKLRHVGPKRTGHWEVLNDIDKEQNTD